MGSAVRLDFRSGLGLVLLAYRYLLVFGRGAGNQQTIFGPFVMRLTQGWCLRFQTVGSEYTPDGGGRLFGPGGSPVRHGLSDPRAMMGLWEWRRW